VSDLRNLPACLLVCLRAPARPATIAHDSLPFSLSPSAQNKAQLYDLLMLEQRKTEALLRVQRASEEQVRFGVYLLACA
jgi:hypothetical protein